MSRILVVDSSVVFRRRMRSILENAGHEALEASSMREALQTLFMEAPDGVVLDLILPEREGLELVQELRRRQFDGPVVVVTADHQPMTHDLARSHGATEILTEPVEPFHLATLFAEERSLA